jgi:CRP/FNR family cyclic AMP-dependent transcriptional regulator
MAQKMEDSICAATEALDANHLRRQAATARSADRSILSKQELFSELSSATLQALETVKLPTVIYPAGAMLFGEGRPARGAFVVSRGRVKLSFCAEGGKTLILRVAEAGQMLGTGAALSGRPYEATAETLETSEISFMRQSDLLRLMRVHNDFALYMAKQLSEEYNSTCHEMRSLLLSHSAAERLARVLLGWLDKSDDPGVPEHFRLTLTHDEIAQMIGTSRETVTRLFAEFRKKQFIQRHGSTLVVRNRGALESLVPP